MSSYDQARRCHYYQADYGLRPGQHIPFKMFAEDELDVINRIYDLHPDAIIHDVWRVGF